MEIAVLEPVTALAMILPLETHPLSEGKYPNLQIHEESHRWKAIVSALAMALCYNILAGYNAHEKL